MQLINNKAIDIKYVINSHFLIFESERQTEWSVVREQGLLPSLRS